MEVYGKLLIYGNFYVGLNVKYVETGNGISTLTRLLARLLYFLSAKYRLGSQSKNGLEG